MITKTFPFCPGLVVICGVYFSYMFMLTRYMWVVVATLDSARVKPCFFIWGSGTVADRPKQTDRNTATAN